MIKVLLVWMMISNTYIRSTKEGKLYIPTRDFFKQERVIELIKKFKDFEYRKLFLKQ